MFLKWAGTHSGTRAALYARRSIRENPSSDQSKHLHEELTRQYILEQILEAMRSLGLGLCNQ